MRAGAIFAARLRFSAMDKLTKFVNSEKPVIGICNGFQVLAELGLIPDIDGKHDRVVTLTQNISNRFECRYVYIKMTSKNRIFNSRFSNGKPRQIPVAHAEGRLMAASEKLMELIDENGQFLFRYSNPDGTGCGYPWNPNGSAMDVAAITNSMGNVIGMMPHPERVYYNFQMMGNEKNDINGTGKDFFDSIVDFIKKK